MHDHGESGGTIQQMDKGDQTLAFAMRKSRPNHSTTHRWRNNTTGQGVDREGVGTAAAASSLAAHLTCTKKNSESQAH